MEAEPELRVLLLGGSPAHLDGIAKARLLTERQKERLDELLAVNQPLHTVCVLKDQLKAIFDYRHPGWARRALARRCALAEASALPPLQRFARGLLAHEDAIVNHARYPIHTGRLEGMHNRMKVIKRQAYGFRDDACFILKVRAAFPGHLHPD